MDVYTFTWILGIGVLLLGVGFTILTLYILRLKKTSDEMQENGALLEEQASVLNEYYVFADSIMREIFANYSVFKETGINTIIKHRYFGDDPTIQHFIKETLGFDKLIVNKMEKYNTNVQRIFEEKEEK